MFDVINIQRAVLVPHLRGTLPGYNDCGLFIIMLLYGFKRQVLLKSQEKENKGRKNIPRTYKIWKFAKCGNKFCIV